MTTTIGGKSSDNVLKTIHSIVWDNLPALLPTLPVIALSWSLMSATNLAASPILPMIAMSLIMASLGWAFSIVRQAANQSQSTSPGTTVGPRRHFATAARAGCFGLVVGGAISSMAFAQIAMENGAPVEVLMAGQIGSGVLLLLAFALLPAALLRSAEKDRGDPSFYELVGTLSRSPKILFHGACVTASFISVGVVFGPIVMGGIAPYITASYAVALEPLRPSR